MYHLPFPIRDYLNDCSLILDSSSRVVMGMIEMAKQKRLFDITQTSIYIQQAIYQGFGCNLPYVTYPIWKKMLEKFNGLAGIVEDFGKGDRSKEYDQIIKFLSKNIVEYDANKKKKILDALRSFPRMKLRVKAFSFDSETNSQNNDPIKEGGEALIEVEIFK